MGLVCERECFYFCLAALAVSWSPESRHAAAYSDRAKTSRKYTTPVSYYVEGDALWVLTSRNRTWWRNVKTGADVSMLLRGKEMIGFAEAELDDQTVQVHLNEYLRHEPRAARALGIRVRDGLADGDDVARVSKGRLFVRICPK